jgi:hypothetical protein
MDRLLQFDVTHACLVVFVAAWVDVLTLPLVAGRLWWSGCNWQSYLVSKLSHL